MVPCDTVALLDHEYGKENWKTPIDFTLTSSRPWTNVFYYKNWTNSEWPYVARFYERNGNIDINQTLTYLNKNLKVKLDSLPNLN